MIEIFTVVPSLTVKVEALPLIVVPSYDAEPLPVVVIERVYVTGMASNSTLTVVLALILLIVYWLFETVTVELFTFTLFIR